MRSPLALLAAAALVLGACSYTYSNPAERLDAGEVTGRLVADLSGNGQLSGVSGVGVVLKNSTNSQTSRDNGRFFMLGMVTGRHTLLFTKGTTWALQRDVELAFGSDGQIEGVVMGDLRLRYSVALGGTFSAPETIDALPATAPTAFVFDEATGVTGTALALTDGLGFYTGQFSYTFPPAPVGPHRIRFGIEADVVGFRTTYVGGPLTQNIPDTSEGQSITLAEATLRVPDPTPFAARLLFRVAPAPGSPTPTIVVDTVPPTGPITPAPVPDSTGLVEVDVSEGLYTVFLDLGATPGSFEAPPTLTAVAVANQTTELGTIYVVDTTTVNAGSKACLTTADCYTMEVCSGGTCVFNEPAQPALCVTGPQIDSECSLSVNGCVSTPPSSNTPCSGGLGVCGQTPSLVYVCIPNGQPDCRFDPYFVPRPVCL